MNGIWTLAESRPDLFPGVENPGRQSTVDVVGEITGLDIDHSVVINLRGFQAPGRRDGRGRRQRAGAGVRPVPPYVQRRHRVHRGPGGVDRARAAAPRRPPRPLVRPLPRRQRRLQPDAAPALRRRCPDGAGRPGGAARSATRSSRGSSRTTSASTSRASELPAWVDLALRIQEGGSIRSLPLTSNVVTPGNPDFDEIRALVQEGPEAARRRPPRPAPRRAPPRARRPTATDEPTSTLVTEPDRDAGRLRRRVARRDLLTGRVADPPCPRGSARGS